VEEDGLANHAIRNEVNHQNDSPDSQENVIIKNYYLTSAIGVARWFAFKSKIPIWVNFGGL
jgi:hypothetical protein